MARNERIDFLRGIAIFFVLWGHCIQYGAIGDYDFFLDFVFKTIYSFHMPLFALLSGYTLFTAQIKYNMKELLLRKTKSLVGGAVLWGGILYFVRFVVETFLHSGHATLRISELINCILSIWFLWATYFCSLIIIFVNKIRNKVFSLLGYLGGLLILSTFRNSNLYIFLYIFFLIGYGFARSEDIQKIMKKYMIWGIILFPYLLLYYSKDKYIYTSGLFHWNSGNNVFMQISIDIYRWIIGLTGSIFVIWFSNTVFDTLHVWVKKTLVMMGRNSFQIYVIQIIVVEYIGAKINWKISNAIGERLIEKYDYFYDWCVALPLTIAYLIMIIIMLMIRMKIICIKNREGVKNE